VRLARPPDRRTAPTGVRTHTNIGTAANIRQTGEAVDPVRAVQVHAVRIVIHPDSTGKTTVLSQVPRLAGSAPFKQDTRAVMSVRTAGRSVGRMHWANGRK
jgi:hypothetical protein